MKYSDLHEAFRSHFEAAFSEWKLNKRGVQNLTERDSSHFPFIFPSPH